MDEITAEKMKHLSKRAARDYKADIYALVGPINDEARYRLGKQAICPNRKHALLILATDGGLLSSAYQMGRLLQKRYQELTIFIPSYCKSAGTLLAIAANQIIMSTDAELGPIDTQIALPGEHKFVSALCGRSAIRAINEDVRGAYVEGIQSLLDRSQGRFTTEEAFEFSAGLVGTVYKNMVSKIDPISYGASERALREATDYAARLSVFSENIDADGISRLADEYASHDFVIDRLEASTIFKSVLEPTRALKQLGEVYAEFASHTRRETRGDFGQSGTKRAGYQSFSLVA